MFKENRQFWLYLLGIIVLFFVLFMMMRSGFNSGAVFFDGFPFNLRETLPRLFSPADYQVDQKKQYEAVITTSLGKIRIELYADAAPNTVSNFISLSNGFFYDGLPFHRLIKGYLLQGGSPNANNKDPNDDKFGGPGYTIPDEINWDSLDYSDSLKAELTAQGYSSASIMKSKDVKKYSVIMASNGPNTGGSQFAIILANTDDPRVQALRGKHTVFGHVIGGFDVIEKLNSLEVERADSDAPFPDGLTIYSVAIFSRD